MDALHVAKGFLLHCGSQVLTYALTLMSTIPDIIVHAQEAYARERAAEAEERALAKRRLAEGIVQLPLRDVSVRNELGVWIPLHFTGRLMLEYIAVRRTVGGVALTQNVLSMCT